MAVGVDAEVFVCFGKEARKFGVADDGFGAALAADVAVQADDGVALRHDEVQVVRDHQYGAVAALLDVADDGVKAGQGGRVDAGGRFVEDDELRLLQDGAGEQEALGFPAGEVLQAGVEFAGDAEACEPRVAGFGAQVLQEARGGDGHVGWRVELLRDVGHAQSGTSADYAAVRAGFAGDEGEQGGFARAVGANDGEDFPVHDAQVDVM